MEIYVGGIRTYYEVCKGTDDGTEEALRRLPITKYDVTESNITSKTLAEIYCVHKLDGKNSHEHNE